MARILVVDDEPQILHALRRTLVDSGHTVLMAATGAEAVDLAATQSPDLVILDLRLPDISGVEVTRTIRRWSDAPVLILSGVGDEASKVEALDCGADDYLEKPFGLAEFNARVRALQRRRHEAEDLPSAVFGSLSVDFAAETLLRDGVEVRLTPIEWLLLRAFARHPGKLLTHRWLAREIWGEGYGDEMRQGLRTHLRALRAKLGDDAVSPTFIRTETGAGYRWVAELEDRVPTLAPIASPNVEPGVGVPPATPTDPDELTHTLNNALTAAGLSLDQAQRRLAAMVADEQRKSVEEALARCEEALSRAGRTAHSLAAGRKRAPG